MDDLFARFVGLLAGNLDEHGRTGTDLAARLYLSRSHLDRLVTAAAGESPARFRRRVLLERAAYRLRTSDTGILDAAVAAGYSSHEAFTRAFQRAYGASPSRWRDDTRGIFLDTPNGVHFHPPGGLRLPARDRGGTMSFVTDLVEHHVALLRQMLTSAQALPDEVLDAPIGLTVEGIDTDPTLRSLLSRLVGQLDMWTAAMRSDAYDFAVERHETVESMRRRLDSAGDAFSRYVRDVDEHGRYDETFVDATGDRPYVFTAGGMIAHVLTYAAHRRTLVTGALASAGIDVDDDPLTWFAPA
jgi:AraC family transcriptional regulator